MAILCHEITRSFYVAPSPRPTIEKDLLGPQKWRKKVTKTGQGDAKSVEDDGPRYGEPYNVTKEEWEEEHWNKTRTLREVRGSSPFRSHALLARLTNQRVPDMGKC